MDTSQLRPTIVQAITDAESLLTRLTAVLADIDGDAESIHLQRQGRWTPEMVATLWPKVTHLDGVRALFTLTAERPDQAITFTELIARSGLPEQQQRNEHARLSRITAELFGEKRWPIENWQGNAPTAGGKAEMMYRMSGTVAAWWHRAIG
jgi:hypothetical protein